MTIAEQRALLAQRIEACTSCRTRLHRSEADATASYQRDYESHPIFKVSEPQHKKKVFEQLQQATSARRTAAGGAALFNLETAVRQSEPAVAAARMKAMRAPDPESVVTRRAGLLGLSLTDSLLVRVFTSTETARLGQQLAAAQPADVSALYAAALADPTDLGNAVAIATIEDMFRNGWNCRPLKDEQLEDAKRLRRTIEQSRAARIPDEIVEAERDLANARSLIQRTRDLDRLSPIDPERHPEVAQVLADELKAEAEQQEQQQ